MSTSATMEAPMDANICCSMVNLVPLAVMLDTKLALVPRKSVAAMEKLQLIQLVSKSRTVNGTICHPPPLVLQRVKFCPHLPSRRLLLLELLAVLHQPINVKMEMDSVLSMPTASWELYPLLPTVLRIADSLSSQFSWKRLVQELAILAASFATTVTESV